MVHSVRGVQVKTARSPENVCHTRAPERCVHDKALYNSTFTFTFTRKCFLSEMTTLQLIACVLNFVNFHIIVLQSKVLTHVKLKIINF